MSRSHFRPESPSRWTVLLPAPRSQLREADPAKLAETFGKGVELVSIASEVARDRVSEPRPGTSCDGHLNREQQAMVGFYQTEFEIRGFVDGIPCSGFKSVALSVLADLGKFTRQSVNTGSRR
jgi:hypothetical protein